MTLQAQVLYDFQAQPGSGEISISVGEFITITRQDVGEGWYEGINERGESGLFPETYVQICSSGGPPDVPPPPLPPGFNADLSPSRSGSFPAGVTRAESYQNNPAPPPPAPDDYDDDWSDEENQEQSTQPGQHGKSADQSAPANKGGGTVKKNINRFSNFVKSGTESFLLGSAKPVASQSREKVAEIIVGPEGICWKPSVQPYSCRVDSPKKSSKLKGLKSFISYQLTPSLTGIQVSRRYKHFDWLHARLVEKFSFLPIPPLPEKQVSGRYEEEFIEHRMAILQVWIDKICRHPILSQCDVWLHFITCTDDKKWKVGKRQAEKDEFLGGLWFLNVVTPGQSLDLNDVELKVETFGRMARNLDDSVKNFSAMIGDTAKKMQGPYKREYLKMATAFRLLGQAFEMDPSRTSSLVITEATKGSADCYDGIAQLFATQSRVDLEPLMDSLFAYKGILASVPDMINTYRSAMGKLRDHQKLMDEGRCSREEFDAIRSRVDVISYVMMAEIHHFQSERIHDFNEMLPTFFRCQVSFHQQIVTQLQVALKQFGVNNNQ